MYITCTFLLSEFAGQLLRVDGGAGIFLDVGLLSEVLNPIVDHKLPNRIFTTHALNASKNRLLTTGVLCPSFARHLWRNLSLAHAPQPSTDQLETAFFDVLIKLGLAFPLGRVPLPEESHDRSASVGSHNGGSRDNLGLALPLRQGPLPANDHSNASVTSANYCSQRHVEQRDMLVWRWLPEHLGQYGETAFNALLDKLKDGGREVVLNWEFDSAGAPHGLMERLIALCHVVGEAEEALCWRSGAVFRSPRVAGYADPLYVVEIRYSNTERVLSVKMFGTLQSERVWAALRFVASLMVDISHDWPGALWAGWVKCATHPLKRLQLETPTEVRPTLMCLDGDAQ